MKLIEVRGDDETVLGELARIADATLGAGLYDVPKFRAAAGQPTATLIAAALPTGIAGCAYGEELDDDRSWYEQFGARAHAYASRPRVVSIRELAVAEAHQGRGIGRALAEAVLAWARARGAEHAIAAAWLSPAPHTSAPLFNRLGFERFGVAPAPYEADSRARGWSCLFCGGPCTCQAALYGLALRP